jgi:DNA-directed RNA polymerase specialized sigma24 family protein
MRDDLYQEINAISRQWSLPSQQAMKLPREVLDRYYQRVLGFAYQVLGDAELAAQAVENVFVRRRPPTTEAAVWATALDVLQQYLQRGFVVRPLTSVSQSWQAELLQGLAQLPPLERALLLLRYHENLDPALLAEIYKQPERTIRERVAAARARLLDDLERIG